MYDIVHFYAETVSMGEFSFLYVMFRTVKQIKFVPYCNRYFSFDEHSLKKHWLRFGVATNKELCEPGIYASIQKNKRAVQI